MAYPVSLCPANPLYERQKESLLQRGITCGERHIFFYRVRVIGILKEIPVPLQSGAISTRFDLAIEANNVIPQEEIFEEFEISEEDERQIQELAADKQIFQKMTHQ